MDDLAALMSNERLRLRNESCAINSRRPRMINTRMHGYTIDIPTTARVRVIAHTQEAAEKAAAAAVKELTDAPESTMVYDHGCSIVRGIELTAS